MAGNSAAGCTDGPQETTAAWILFIVFVSGSVGDNLNRQMLSFQEQVMKILLLHHAKYLRDARFS